VSVLAVRSLSKRFPGAAAPAVADVSLTLESGEIVAVLGESGCGKSTLLRMIAGLETPSAGEIAIADRVVFNRKLDVPTEERGVGLVFQDYALFPHLDVASNVAYGLHRLRRAERGERVRELLALVGLEHLARRFPHELSGGQQQRVALARALAPRPAVLLLDEPFSNLDVVLKQQVREEVSRILRRAGTTALFVLHDIEDALAVGDRLAVLRDGRIQQLDTPEALFARPSHAYVARFLGETNLIPGTAVAGGFRTPIGFLAAPQASEAARQIAGCHGDACVQAACLRHPARAAAASNGNGRGPGGDEHGTAEPGEPEAVPVTLSVRPEQLEVVDGEVPGVDGVVERCVFCGDHQRLTVVVTCNGGVTFDLTVRAPGDRPLPRGAKLRVRPRPDGIQVLPAE
jgi:iron(III) transport system ATP-binding protein